MRRVIRRGKYLFLIDPIGFESYLPVLPGDPLTKIWYWIGVMDCHTTHNGASDLDSGSYEDLSMNPEVVAVVEEFSKGVQSAS